MGSRHVRGRERGQAAWRGRIAPLPRYAGDEPISTPVRGVLILCKEYPAFKRAPIAHTEKDARQQVF